METQQRTLRFGHSPDVDDAYMFFGLATGLVKVGEYRIEHCIAEIEQLNRIAMRGEYEVTAVSAHGYIHVADSYAVMGAGASVARGYGPVVVAERSTAPQDLAGKVVAVPGEHTTAFLLAQLYLPDFKPLFVPFREVEATVRSGKSAAAILIHEGQMEVNERGFKLVMDLGIRFQEDTGCPLPLGLDIVRRDLGMELGTMIARALRASIEVARVQHDRALDYALPYGRGIDRKTAERFVGMYVNEDTLSLPDDAVEGLNKLCQMAANRGLAPRIDSIDIWR